MLANPCNVCKQPYNHTYRCDNAEKCRDQIERRWMSLLNFEWASTKKKCRPKVWNLSKRRLRWRRDGERENSKNGTLLECITQHTIGPICANFGRMTFVCVSVSVLMVATTWPHHFGFRPFFPLHSVRFLLHVLFHFDFRKLPIGHTGCIPNVTDESMRKDIRYNIYTRTHLYTRIPSKWLPTDQHAVTSI